MKIEYQLTYEDYAEALRSQSRAKQTWIFLLLFVALIAIGIIASFKPSSLASTLIMPLLPWLFIMVGIWSFIFTRMRGRRQKPWEKGPVSASADRLNRMSNWAVIFLVVAGTGIAVYLLNRTPSSVGQATGGPTPPVAKSPSISDILIPLIPWLLIFGFIIGFFKMSRKGGGKMGISLYRRLWDQQTSLHRPTTVEFSEDGCTIVQTFVRHEYKWEYFPGAFETPNLFILYLNPLSFHFFPKRAFASDAEREAMRQLLQAKVSEPTSAFPVIMK